jgi:hypothetical protein
MGIFRVSKASAAVDGHCVVRKSSRQAAAAAATSLVLSPARAPLAHASSSLSRSGALFCSWSIEDGHIYPCAKPSIRQLSWPGDTSIAAVAWQ